MNPSVNEFSLRGKLSLKLRMEQGRVAGVEIVSTRPQAAFLLKGKTPQQAVHLAPLIFSLCGGAQGVAAQAALLAATGAVADEAQLARWAGAIRREASTEHLWRLMLDWPQYFGMDRLEAEYASCRMHCLTASNDEAHAAALQTAMLPLLGMPAQDWLALDLHAFAAWRDESPSLGARLLRRLEKMPLAGRSNAPFLPGTVAQDWAGYLAGLKEVGTLEFCKLPAWRGEPRETGALARQHGNSLVAPLLADGRRVEARLLARLVELAQWASGEAGRAQDWVDAVPCGPDAGVARAETARGVLLHRARVEHGAIADYAVVAPTEWNFHPRGTFAIEAKCLEGQGEAALMHMAQGLALSLDPCVEYEVVPERV